MSILAGVKRLLGLESRAHPSSSTTNWKLYGFDVGKETSSGVNVDEDSAQSLTVVYACVRAIAETVGSLPFYLFRKLSEDQRERATDHPLYPIINKKPNPEMVDMVFRETMMLHLNTWGNFYANIQWKSSGIIEALWPLRPDRVQVIRKDKELWYIYTLESGEQRTIDRKEMLHIPGLGFDGTVGYSPIAKNAEAIGLAMAAEEYGSRFFQNDARPGVILKHPGELSQPAQDRLRKSWEEMHKGLSNKHRLGILEEGMDFATIGIPPQEAQWIELRKFQLPEICRIYRVPPPVIGDLERSTFANIQELTEHFGKYCIYPWLRRVEQHYNSKLLSEKDQETYYTEHNMDAMLRSDMNSRYTAYATGRQWGWLSANDILRRENMDAIDGGDIYLSPSNMVPSEMIGKIPPTQNFPAPGKGGMGGKDNEEKINSAFELLFTAAMKRIVNRETLAIGKVVSKTKDDITRAIEDLYGKKMDGYIRESVGPILRAYLNSFSMNGHDVEGYTDRFIGGYILASRKKLENLLDTSTDENRQVMFSEVLAGWKDSKVFENVNDVMSLADKLH